ncbi:unnamed protein product [Prorocentrum cordatum]|uniref:Beta-lactamase-related domain-containing protein n=1 Tax=Prorocentrum cordatum TaxID=2364126 RepID=A0ABN9SE56_9DINO|nr:unnamed protein product [Polarella glacialis]
MLRQCVRRCIGGLDLRACTVALVTFVVVFTSCMCFQLAFVDALNPEVRIEDHSHVYPTVQGEGDGWGTRTSIVAYDAGLYFGPPNSVLAAQRSLQNGATSLGVDLSITLDDELVGAHSSSEWIAHSAFSKRAQDLHTITFEQAELSPTCETFKQFYLSIGVSAAELTGLQACERQRMSTADEFLQAFPGIPIIFDLKAPSWQMQQRQVHILYELLCRKFPDRHADATLTSLRLFAFPNQSNPTYYFENVLGSTTLPFTFSIGVPAQRESTWSNIDTLRRSLTSSTGSRNGVPRIFLTPSEMKAASRLFRVTGRIIIICDLAAHELDQEINAAHAADYRDLHSWTSELQVCVENGAAAIHTSRFAPVLAALRTWSNFTRRPPRSKKEQEQAGDGAATRSPASSEPERLRVGRPGEGPDASLVLLGRAEAPGRAQRFAVGPAASGASTAHQSTWMRCAGKLATVLLVVRLVEIGMLPGLDEPIVEFLRLSETWLAERRNHSVLQRLTLRHVMAGVGGLPSYQFTPLWVTKKVMPASEICERALGWVDRDFVPGSRWVYSNMQWAIVERAVEVAAGGSFPDAARRYLFDPLGVSTRTYHASETMPSCSHPSASPVYERNLRAAIGLCSTVEDMGRRILGDAVRTAAFEDDDGPPSRGSAFLSVQGVQEVVLDQLHHRFPAALPMFLNTAPATDFCVRGMQWTGRGFAGYYWANDWLVVYGGAPAFWGQRILLRVENGVGTGRVLAQWVSAPTVPKSTQAFVERLFHTFTAAPEKFSSLMLGCQPGAHVNQSSTILRDSPFVTTAEGRTTKKRDHL